MNLNIAIAIVILVALLLLIVLVYKGIVDLKDGLNKNATVLALQNKQTNDKIYAKFQTNMDNYVNQIRGISSNNLQQLRKITLLNHQPIVNRISNHFTETDDGEMRTEIQYFSETRTANNTNLNNIENDNADCDIFEKKHNGEFYMSEDETNDRNTNKKKQKSNSNYTSEYQEITNNNMMCDINGNCNMNYDDMMPIYESNDQIPIYVPGDSTVNDDSDEDIPIYVSDIQQQAHTSLSDIPICGSISNNISTGSVNEINPDVTNNFINIMELNKLENGTCDTSLSYVVNNTVEFDDTSSSSLIIGNTMDTSDEDKCETYNAIIDTVPVMSERPSFINDPHKSVTDSEYINSNYLQLNNSMSIFNIAHKLGHKNVNNIDNDEDDNDNNDNDNMLGTNALLSMGSNELRRAIQIDSQFKINDGMYIDNDLGNVPISDTLAINSDNVNINEDIADMQNAKSTPIYSEFYLSESDQVLLKNNSKNLIETVSEIIDLNDENNCQIKIVLTEDKQSEDNLDEHKPEEDIHGEGKLEEYKLEEDTQDGYNITGDIVIENKSEKEVMTKNKPTSKPTSKPMYVNVDGYDVPIIVPKSRKVGKNKLRNLGEIDSYNLNLLKTIAKENNLPIYYKENGKVKYFRKEELYNNIKSFYSQ